MSFGRDCSLCAVIRTLAEYWRTTANISLLIRQTEIDLSDLDTGVYQLTLRREGGEWQMFPFESAEPEGLVRCCRTTESPA